jgi:hypothetical protein
MSDLIEKTASQSSEVDDKLLNDFLDKYYFKEITEPNLNSQNSNEGQTSLYFSQETVKSNHSGNTLVDESTALKLIQSFHKMDKINNDALKITKSFSLYYISEKEKIPNENSWHSQA